MASSKMVPSMPQVAKSYDALTQFPIFAKRQPISSLEKIVQAWHSIVANNAALRTIVQKHSTSLRYDVLDTIAPVTFGQAWCSGVSGEYFPPAQLVVNLEGTTFQASVHIHRALIDSTSSAIIRNNLSKFAAAAAPADQPSYDEANREPSMADIEASKSFWKECLVGLTTSPFHCFGFRTPEQYADIHDQLSTRQLNLVCSFARKSNLSLRTVLQSAWAIVVTVHSQASNGSVAFSTIGRDATLKTVIGSFDRKYVLVVPIDGKTPISEWIQHIERQDRAASKQAFIGYDAILEETAGEYLPASHLHISAATEEIFDSDEGGMPSLQLGCKISPNDSAISFTLRYDSQIPQNDAQILLDHYSTALEYICSSVTVADCTILSSFESQRLLGLATPVTEVAAGIVHHLFERQVELTPAATAVQFETEETLTYAALNKLANSVARQFQCKQGALIPVSLPRSINLIVAILAIVKAGCAYVPLDPSVPDARNRFIYQDTDAPFAIVSKTTSGVFPNELVIEDLTSRAHEYDCSNLDVQQTPEDLVYVVYTSGSTGKPKGVLLQHKAAHTGLVAFPKLDDLRQLLFHNPVFSAAQRSIWSTLKQGGCLCLASKENLASTISDTINSMKVNVIDVTPSTASFITPGTVPSLRRMTVAGELINPALVPLWVNELEFLNAYGLSENTQFNWRQIISPGQNPQNIGRPCDTTTSFVLLPGTMQLAPLLVPGELCLGGHQLARGYLNRPEKTAEVFIPNPFGEGRLYRTGDLVVTHADGSLEMIGRIDFSVKINDQRVDPGEPNSLIQLHQRVRDCAVVAATVSGTRALVAVVQADTAEDYTNLKNDLRTHLEEHLPPYMIPTYWLFRRELPLNINGKVDIPLLQKMCEELGWQGLSDRGPPSSTKYVWTTDETLVRDILAQVASVPAEELSPSDSFLDIGGNSLSSIQATGLATKHGLRLPTMKLLQGMTISELASNLRVGAVEKDPYIPAFNLAPKGFVIAPDSMEDAFLATPLQEAVLADSLLQKADYMIKKAYSTDGLQHEDLIVAIKMAIEHSPLMRSTFVTHGTSFVQVIQKHLQAVWHHFNMPVEEYVQHRASLIAHDNVGSLGGPMLRVVTLNSALVLEMHHALCDHWTAQFFVQDIRSALRKRALNKRPPFRNFVQYLNVLDKGPSLEYWQTRLKGRPSSWLEKGSPRPFGAQVELPFDLHATNESSTASSMIYLAWAVVLSKWTSSKDVTFGVTASGRDAPVADIMNIEGPTLSVAPLSLRVDDGQIIASSLKDITAAFWELNSHSHVGMHRILRQEGIPDSLFNTTVNVLVRPPEEEANGILRPMDDLLRTELDLLHIDYIDGDRPLLRATSAWSFPQAERMFVDLISMLRMIVQNPQMTIGTAKIRLEEAPPTPPRSDKVVHDASQGVHDGNAAEATLLHPDSSPGLQTSTSLSIPSIPKTAQILQASGGQAFWSAVWAIFLSRHMSTQFPLFGMLLMPAMNENGWEISPRSFIVDPMSKVEAVVVAAAKNTVTFHSTNATIASSRSASPFQFNDIPFDTLLCVIDDEAASGLGENSSPRERCTLLTVVETQTKTHLHLSSFIDQDRAGFILQSVALIAQAIVYQGGTVVKALDIVSTSEREHLRRLASHSSPSPTLLHEAFEVHARVDPNAIALQLEGSVKVTYGELNSRANRLARYLIRSGVKEKQAVALYLHKSVNMLASILAVLKVGAFYVPLSPENPAERNLLIMDAVHAMCLIWSTTTSDAPSRPGQDVIVVDAIDTAPFDDQNLGIGCPDNLAYIVFTSGSTGTPKGVKVSHRAISTAITGIIKAEGTDSSWRGLFFFNYIFDASMHDIFPILSSGGTLCIASEERLRSDLAGVVNEMDIRQLFLMPTIARLLRPEDVPGLKVFIVGGELLHQESIKLWTADSSRKMYQIYGPTEASVIVAMKDMSADTNPRNLGRPMHTASAMVLDFDSDLLSPLGAIGELCLAGNQLAEGYWQREDLTAKAFIPSPFADDSGMSKVYRTGDRVRWLPGGELEYLGRIDHQVKLNGFRIELGEIEQTILRTGLVSNCAVTVLQQSGRPQLAAFCVLEPSSEMAFQDPSRFSTSLSMLRNSITSLAHYMIPKLIFPMGRFPTMHASTKTDRKMLNYLAESLSNVELARYSDAGDQTVAMAENTVPVLSEEERFLQQAWSDLFKVDPHLIGANSSFFALGGDSIAAIILVDACRKAGYTLTVSKVAKDKELAKIATHLHRKKSSVETIQSQTYEVPPELDALLPQAGIIMSDIEYAYPCPAGQTEWLEQGDKQTQNWIVTAVRPFPSQHNVEDYIHTLRTLTHHNDVLRTTFAHLPDQGWVGLVFRASVVDFEIRSCGKEETQHFMDDMANSFFKFGRPFVRYLLLQYPDGSRDLIIKANHGIWDGTSLRIVDESLLALQRTGEALENTPFRDFVFAEWSSDKGKSLTFWRRQLADSIPAWPPATSPMTNCIHKHQVSFKEEIDEFAGTCGVTPSIVFQGAFQLWQAAMSGQTVSAFDYLLTGRNVDLPNPQTINGPCANFLPFRLPTKRSESVQHYLQRTQNQFWEATEHSNVALSDIRRATGQELQHTCLFLFQPFEKASGPAPTEMRWLVLAPSQAQMKQPYALIQEISKPLGGSEYSFDLKYDDSVLSLEAIQRAVAYQVDVLRKWIAVGGSIAVEQTVPQMAAM